MAVEFVSQGALDDIGKPTGAAGTQWRDIDLDGAHGAALRLRGLCSRHRHRQSRNCNEQCCDGVLKGKSVIVDPPLAAPATWSFRLAVKSWSLPVTPRCLGDRQPARAQRKSTLTTS